MSDALKHGVSNDQIGTVLVDIKQISDKVVELSISDVRQGIPSDMDLANSESLGCNWCTCSSASCADKSRYSAAISPDPPCQFKWTKGHGLHCTHLIVEDEAFMAEGFSSGGSRAVRP